MPSVNFAILFIVFSAIDVVLSKSELKLEDLQWENKFKHTNTLFVKKGDSFTIGCSLRTPSGSSIDDYRLEWLINDKVFQAEYTSDLEVIQKKVSNKLISEFSQRDVFDSFNLKCHPRGYSNLAISKQIKAYSMKIEYNVENPLRHNEKNLGFNCTYNGITGEDIEEIAWHVKGKKIDEKDDKIYKISKHETYSEFIIKHPKISEDAGNVTCQIRTKSGSTLSDLVVVSSEPHVEFEEERSKNLVQGDPLTLKCKVSGSPAPTRIYWKNPKDNILSIDVDSRITLKDSNATLKIKDIDFEDKGTYTCFASNSYGEYNATITVRVKDKLAALWPFLGICAEVFILCSIIFIYERSRKKKDTDNTVDDEAGDKLTNSNDNQVRQRRS